MEMFELSTKSRISDVLSPFVRRWYSVGVLYEFSQPLDEPRSGRTVDDVVIERHRKIEKLAGGEFPVDESRLPADPPDGHLQRVIRRTDCPSTPLTEHPHRSDSDGTRHVLPPPRKPLRKPPDEPPDEPGESERHRLQTRERCRIRCLLGSSYLVVNRLDRPFVGPSNDVGNAQSLAVDRRLDKYVHVDVVEYVDPTTPITIRVDVGMVSDGSRETEHDECGKRKLLPCLLLDGPDTLSRLSDVELDEAVDVASPACRSHVIDRPPTAGGERLDSIITIAHTSHHSG